MVRVTEGLDLYPCPVLLPVADLLTGVPLIDNLLVHDQLFVKSLHSFF